MSDERDLVCTVSSISQQERPLKMSFRGIILTPNTCCFHPWPASVHLDFKGWLYRLECLL